MAHVIWPGRVVIGTEGVDIQPTATSVASVDGELLGLALPLDVTKNRFHTMLMKLTQLPKANQVAQ